MPPADHSLPSLSPPGPSPPPPDPAPLSPPSQGEPPPLIAQLRERTSGRCPSRTSRALTASSTDAAVTVSPRASRTMRNHEKGSPASGGEAAARTSVQVPGSALPLSTMTWNGLPRISCGSH
eukprot:scaffold15670_cov112-Isochrysis_galbana.AAC.13